MKEHENALPRYKQAVIPEDKFLKYTLDPLKDPNKSIAFEKALGYNKNNAYLLIENILNNLPYYNAMPRGDIGYGMRYQVIMNLTGQNGKSAKVLTAWIDDKNTGEMRLTTAYVDK